MTRPRRPLIRVPDDREGLVRSAPGMTSLRELCEIEIIDRRAAARLNVVADGPLPVDHPLRSLANAVFTQHVAWTAQEVFAESAATAANQVANHSEGHLDPVERPDPDVMPAAGAVGGLRGAPRW